MLACPAPRLLRNPVQALVPHAIDMVVMILGAEVSFDQHGHSGDCRQIGGSATHLGPLPKDDGQITMFCSRYAARWTRLRLGAQAVGGLLRLRPAEDSRTRNAQY